LKRIKVARKRQTLLSSVVHKMRSFILYWLPMALLMVLIFGVSSDAGSFEHSSRIVGPLLHWLFPNMPAENIKICVLVVRKFAHLSEYGLLALLFWRARRNGAPENHGSWQWSSAAEALWFALLYAATDEFHQTFVPSREGCIRDVIIDGTGALGALLLLWAIGRWRKFW
jgi:VanZ family protein